MRLCRGRNDEMTDMVISNKKNENLFINYLIMANHNIVAIDTNKINYFYSFVKH
jgi:hypothetical protein